MGDTGQIEIPSAGGKKRANREGSILNLINDQIIILTPRSDRHSQSDHFSN